MYPQRLQSEELTSLIRQYGAPGEIAGSCEFAYFYHVISR